MAQSQQDSLFDLPPSATNTEKGSAEEGGGDVRNDFDRLSIVHGELGFIPHSRAEMTHAMLVLDYREQPGGFAGYLNTVLHRQINYEVEDPSAALRSIVSSIRGYAGSTKGDKTALLQIQDEVQPYAGVQNFLELTNINNLHGWEAQPGTKRGLGLISRQIRVTKGLNEGEWPGIDNHTSEEAIADLMVEARVYEALAAINDGMQQAGNRHEFWVDCLKQATRHMAVKPLAVEALKKLGVEPSY